MDCPHSTDYHLIGCNVYMFNKLGKIQTPLMHVNIYYIIAKHKPKTNQYCVVCACVLEWLLGMNFRLIKEI